MNKYICFMVIIIVMSSFLNSSYALTPDQILQLRKAGVSDTTIQIMLQQERDAEKNPFDQLGVREIKDKEGNVVTIYSTGSSTRESYGGSEDENVDKAWKMLQNMIIKK